MPFGVMCPKCGGIRTKMLKVRRWLCLDCQKFFARRIPPKDSKRPDSSPPP